MKRFTAFALVLVLAASLARGAAVELAPHPRAVLNTRRLANLKTMVGAGDERFLQLRSQGQASLFATTGSYLPPGYARAGWAEAARSYALLYLVETEPELKKAFAEEALVYMKALAYDYYAVGDGKGGVPAIQAEGGYPIRFHAIGLVTAYDWLYSYEGFSKDLKSHLAVRLNEWIDWYEGRPGEQGGYKAQGPPWENHFAAYFAAKALTAAITYEENPKAQLVYLNQVVLALHEDVLPRLSQGLAGGYPCEGWASRCGYDWMIEAVIALENATEEVFDKRFFSDVVYAVIHSTKPDRKHIYDGGDWQGQFAGYPLPLALMARLSVLLEGTAAAAHARYYVMDFAAGDEFNRVPPVESLVCLDPTAERMDFRLHGRLSHACRGSGALFFRSSWDRDAFWGSFQSGSPHLCELQNLDQGHITVNFLGKDLLIDAGMWREQIGPNAAISNYATGTAWHNTIMIDDLGGGTGLSQGPYGEGKAAAFEEGQRYVYARADITGAYAQDPERRDSNSAVQVTREVWYIRPRAIVVIDDVEPLDSNYPVSVLWHVPHRAKISAAGVATVAEIDSAVLKLFFMLPQKMKIGVFKQFGTREGDEKRGYYTQGVRVTGATDKHKVRFVTVVSAAKAAGAAGDKLSKADMRPESMDASCIVINALDRYVAVGRAPNEDSPVLLKMPVLTQVDLYISGLKPNSNYLVKPTATATLRIRLTPAAAPPGSMTSSAGVLTTTVRMTHLIMPKSM